MSYTATGTTSMEGSAGFRTVFKLTTNGVLTTLLSFTSAANGIPNAGLLLAGDGNFYGCSQGSVNAPFRLWVTSDLSPATVGSWSVVTNGVFAENGSFSFTDNTAASTRFYRVSSP